MFTLFHDLLDLMGKGLSFFYDLIPSYGLAIILLTVAVRLVMLPLTIKQTRSMQEMQKLQPEVKRLQAKYKGGDRQKMNEEMMKLYKEHKVNPLGGCLPLLLQLPIFLALYRVFAGCGAHNVKVCPTLSVGTKYLPAGSALTKAINSVKAGFLGMNLGLAPMAALKAAGTFPGSLVHVLPYFLLILLMVFTTWYQQKQIQAVSTGQQAQQMQMMGKIMPLLLGVFSLQLPAGVSIYWVASNLWTIGQQRFILGKTMAAAPQPEPSGSKAPSARGGTAAKPKPSPKPNAAAKTPPKGLPKTREKAGPKASGGKGAEPGSRPPAKASEASEAAGGDGAAPNGRAKPPAQGASQTAKGNGKAEPKSPQQPSSGNKQPASSSRPRNSNARKKRRR